MRLEIFRCLETGNKNVLHVYKQYLPKDQKRKEEWIRCIRLLCKETDWLPSTVTVVCPKHFRDQDNECYPNISAIVTFASSLLCLSGGLTIGISAVLLPKLEEDEEFYWTKEYGSWIASIAPISSIFSCLCIGSLLDRFGRKSALIMLSFPFIIGWLCMAFANDFYVMMVGRFFTGFSFGAVRSASVIYLGEISDPKYRGIILLCPTLAMNLGVLLSHVIGYLTSWRTALLICVFPNVIQLVLILFFKESPYWLISKGRVNEAIECFRWFRGMGARSENELHLIIEKQNSKGAGLTIRELLKIVFSGSFGRPIVTLFFVFLAMQFSGINVFPFYANDLVVTMFDEKIDTFLVMMIIDLIRVGVCVLICLIGKVMHRRASFLYCAYATVILLFLLVVVRFYEKAVPFKWIPLSLVLFYNGVASVVVSIGWSFIAELFPNNVRGLGSGLAGAISYCLLSSSVKVTPDLLARGEPTMYGTFAIVTLVSSVILHSLLPETHGKTLQAIEDSYNNKDRTTTL